MTRSEIVGRNILKFRTSRGMSQVDFASAIDRSQTMVSMYEKGQRLPSTQIIAKIAEIFGVGFDEIYYSSEELGEPGSSWYQEAFPEAAYDDESAQYDDEVLAIREDMRRNPQLRTLWDLSRNATPKEMKQMEAFIRAIKGSEDE